MAEQLKQNWQLVAAAAAGVAVVGLGLYLLLKTPEEEVAEAAQTTAASTTSASAPVKKAAVAAESAAAPKSESIATQEAEEGEISKEALREILVVMTEKLANLKQQTDIRKIGMLSSGMSPEDVEMAMQTDINEGLQSIEKEIQQSHGVDQYALMEAQSKHASDPEIQVLMGRLRMQFFGEEQMAELAEVEKAAPADMTSDKFYGVMKKHMAVLEKAFRQALVETREVTPSATFDERVQYLEFLMAKRLEQIHEDALSEIGLSEEAFKGCMIKFGNDRRVVELVVESQMKQEQMKEAKLRD